MTRDLDLLQKVVPTCEDSTGHVCYNPVILMPENEGDDSET